jgi:hypothetical protein
MASILHLSAAMESLYSTEGMGHLRLGADIVATAMTVQGGSVALPAGPGLGVALLPNFGNDFRTTNGAQTRVLDLTASPKAYVAAYSNYLLLRQRAATALHRLQRRVAR